VRRHRDITDSHRATVMASFFTGSFPSCAASSDTDRSTRPGPFLHGLECGVVLSLGKSGPEGCGRGIFEHDGADATWSCGGSGGGHQ
jgi:hypothetical protein